MKHIIIVGGGFGGVVAARSLAKTESIRVTLISDRETFRYSAALYRVATGYRKRIALIPIKEMIPENIKFVANSVSGINRQDKSITLSDGKKMSYDKIILSIGAVTSYFKIPGLSELSFGIKDAAGLQALRDHLHQTLIEKHELDKNYVVVGGGPTGVELAAGLASYLRLLAKRHVIKNHAVKLELIEAAPRILPSMSERAAKKASKRLQSLKVKVMTNKKVEAESSVSLHVSGRILPTKTVVWTAGTMNNPFYEQNKSQFELSKRGKVITDQYLRVDDSVYVIGDNAESTYSGLAQTAIHQAKYVAKSIMDENEGKQPKTYKVHRPFYIVPIGSNWSVLEYGPVVITGWISAQLRKAADLIGYAEVMGWRKSYATWRHFDDTEEDCDICKD